MNNIEVVSATFLFIIILSASAFADDIAEPEKLIIENKTLSSSPQTGVDHHILRVCKDFEMSLECTQCIYKANSNGAVNIPAYNRCIFRTYKGFPSRDGIRHGNYYQLYYQLIAVNAEGLKSDWTKPLEIWVYNDIENESSYCHTMIGVWYVLE